jgi:cytochrome P450
VTATEVRSEPAAEVGKIEDASLAESLQFVATGLLPSLARGLFKPRRGAMKRLTALETDARAIRALSSIREKHGGDGVRLLRGKMALLWGAPAIREVLDNSASTYASDGGAKRKGMDHFQPDALTISRGEEWRDRRAFNESVLASSERLHPFAQRFAEVVRDEVDRLRIGPELEWKAFEGLWDHITLRVIFGDHARGDQELTDLLAKLMNQGQRLVGAGEPNDDYYEMYGKIERYLKDPQEGSLVAHVAQAPQSDRTRVAHQVPHWMFAMRDTLGANAYRALALIVADPSLCSRVREEISGADLSDPAAIDGMQLLEGVLHEAMRLWPTTPLLARETTRDVELGGARLEEGTQIFMLNIFNHRAPEGIDDANRVVPERWAGDHPAEYRFNHLSNGSQDCPGGPLVLLLGKAVLAHMLDQWSFKLLEPSLPAGGDQPAMLDFFAIRFEVDPR